MVLEFYQCNVLIIGQHFISLLTMIVAYMLYVKATFRKEVWMKTVELKQAAVFSRNALKSQIHEPFIIKTRAGMDFFSIPLYASVITISQDKEKCDPLESDLDVRCSGKGSDSFTSHKLKAYQ